MDVDVRLLSMVHVCVEITGDVSATSAVKMHSSSGVLCLPAPWILCFCIGFCLCVCVSYLSFSMIHS